MNSLLIRQLISEILQEARDTSDIDPKTVRHSYVPGGKISSRSRKSPFFNLPSASDLNLNLCQQVPGSVANILLGNVPIESYITLPNNEVLLIAKHTLSSLISYSSLDAFPVSNFRLGIQRAVPKRGVIDLNQSDLYADNIMDRPGAVEGDVAAAIRAKFGSLADKYIPIAALNTNEKLESDRLLNMNPKIVFLITSCNNPRLSWELVDNNWKKTESRITWEAVGYTLNTGMWLNLIPKNLGDSIKSLPCSEFETGEEGSACKVGLQADFISTMNKINSALGITSLFLGPELLIPTIPISITLAAYYAETDHPYMSILNYVGAALALVGPVASAYSNAAHLQKAENLAETIHAAAQVRGMNSLSEMGIVSQQEGQLAQKIIQGRFFGGRAYNGITFKTLYEFAKKFPEIAGRQFAPSAVASEAAGEKVIQGWISAEGGYKWVLIGEETGKVFKIFTNSSGIDIIFTKDMTSFLDFASRNPQPLNQ